jgi:hypothetical protein
MAIDFPASPTLNDVFTVGNVTYVWDGTKWTASVTGGISLDKIEEGNTSAEVIDTGSDGRFVVTTEGTERLFVNSNGNISVGSSLNDSVGSTTTLTVDQTSGNGQISLGANGTVRGRIFADNSTGELRIGNPTAGDLMLYTNNTERLRIDSSGRLGIGTSAPATKIQIQHADATASVFRLSRDGDNATTFDIDYNSSSGHVTLGPTLSGSATAFNLGFKVAGSTRMQIDGSGRVGIGTTSPSGKLTVVGGTTSSSTVVVTDNTNYTFELGRSRDNTGSFGYIGGTSGSGLTLGSNDIERVRIDTSGRVLVGTSTGVAIGAGSEALIQGAVSTGFNLALYSTINSSGAGGIAIGKSRNGAVVQNGDDLGSIVFAGHDGTDYQTRSASIAALVDGTPGANDMPGRLVFSTTADGASSPTERMRIRSDGRLLTFSSINTAIVGSTATAAGGAAAVFELNHSATSTTNGTNCFYVLTNGDVRNTNNSYGAISDIKLKENIVDANSQWDDLKALQVRNYNFKPETNQETHTQIGLIAQEVELVSPGLVSESPDRDAEGNDLGTVTKSVNYSVLYMKAVKALQEAIAKIETLEGMVAVNNITIDEQQHQLSTLAARLTALESA